MKGKVYTVKSVWIFFILVAGISALCESVTILQGKIELYIAILMFSPAVAA